MLKTRVTAHLGMLVIETKDPSKDDDFIPAGGDKIGCVLKNTGTRLGISSEALSLLKTVKKSRDDIGEVDSWRASSITSEEVCCFSWLGPPCRLVDPKTAEGSRTYDITRIDFVDIPNEVPEEAIKAIAKRKK